MESLEPRTLFAGQPARPFDLPAASPSHPVVLDLLIVYDQQAVDAAGGVAALDAVARKATDDANREFFNSDVYVTLRLVHTALVNYTDSGSLTTDLDNLQNPNGSVLGDARRCATGTGRTWCPCSPAARPTGRRGSGT